MFCKSCGTDIKDMKYCPNCGTCVEFGTNDNSAMNNKTGVPLKVTQLKFLAASVVVIGWSLLMITSSLLPYIYATATMNYSSDTYDWNGYLYLAIYFVLSIIFYVVCKKSLRKSGYEKTVHYHLAQVVAVNISNLCSGILIFFLVDFAIHSNLILKNSDLWIISLILLLISIFLIVYWCYVAKKIKADNKTMLLVTVLVAFREYWIAFVIFAGVSIFTNMLMAINPLSSLMGILGLFVLIMPFVYPFVRYMISRKIMRSVYKIK